jgi:hypothetical protein
MFPRTHGFAEVAPECRNHDHRCERCEHGQNVPHPARKGTWSHRGC